jgi:hypothetical protein
MIETREGRTRQTVPHDPAVHLIEETKPQDLYNSLKEREEQNRAWRNL